MTHESKVQFAAVDVNASDFDTNQLTQTKTIRGTFSDQAVRGAVKVIKVIGQTVLFLEPQIDPGALYI
ncbi:MAG: hypothetical protein IH991_05060, partial [Planctomycetes bacterium]|nr:hypothetical protein [Planctomycetota bacterium]